MTPAKDLAMTGFHALAAQERQLCSCVAGMVALLTQCLHAEDLNPVARSETRGCRLEAARQLPS